jgi:hypothetical protein
MTAEKFSPRVISPERDDQNWHAIGSKEVLTEHFLADAVGTV